MVATRGLGGTTPRLPFIEDGFSARSFVFNHPQERESEGLNGGRRPEVDVLVLVDFTKD